MKQHAAAGGCIRPDHVIAPIAVVGASAFIICVCERKEKRVREREREREEKGRRREGGRVSERERGA